MVYFPSMRDLEKIRERGVARVTSSQVRALALATSLLVLLAFAVGVELGRSGRRGGAPHQAQAAANKGVDSGIAEAVARRGPPRLSPTVPPSRELQTETVPSDSPSASSPASPPELALTIPPPQPLPSPVVAISPSAEGSGPLSTVQGDWEIQVGAYPHREEAQQALDSLSRLGFQPYLREVRLDGRLWHRVRLGPYASPAEARRQAEALKTVSPYPPIIARRE